MLCTFFQHPSMNSMSFATANRSQEFLPLLLDSAVMYELANSKTRSLPHLIDFWISSLRVKLSGCQNCSKMNRSLIQQSMSIESDFILLLFFNLGRNCLTRYLAQKKCQMCRLVKRQMSIFSVQPCLFCCFSATAFSSDQSGDLSSISTLSSSKTESSMLSMDL